MATQFALPERAETEELEFELEYIQNLPLINYLVDKKWTLF